MFSCVFLSGGKGKRMNNPTPKQYLQLAGKPIFLHTLERLDNIEEIGEIVIVCEPADYAQYSTFISQYGLKKEYRLAAAGKTRQESAYSGLKEAEFEHVLIHEACRPFVKKDDFEKMISFDAENAIFGCPIPYTVLVGGEKIEQPLDREKLVNVQLPQKFNKAKLLDAHRLAFAESRTFTEDASLLYYYDHTDIAILRGESYNIKITEPMDLVTGENIYREFIINRK